ncbi:DMT family transporter [Vitreoscilla massiliensis]|uniref:DMT family transporter n=1 Tax=Vitreoscilla massiliensis TaxID=1689272 RepID=A0ABY4ECE8_9NEIS|nr:DMT family transporter [Vitreoscilla massiliensis]UOO91092.1 DMT family transporter [Vitreoscilla massiliensis]
MTRTRALLNMHFATIFFGLSGVFAALIPSSAISVVWGRTAIAVVVLFLVCALKKRLPWQGVAAKEIGQLLLIGCLLGVHWWSFFYAIKLGGVAIGTLGFSCFPAAIAIIEAVVFKDRISKLELALIGLITLGLVLVTPSFNFANQGTVGLLWGIFSGVIYAVIAACNRVGAAKRQASSLQACWWQFFAITVVTAFAAPQLAELSNMGWLWLACLGVLCTGLAYWLFIDSLSAINARTAAMIFALEPVYAIAIAWAFLHDVPSLRMLLGGGLIIAAVVLSARFKAS